MRYTDATIHLCTVKGLREGLGVEDIAIMYEIAVADVRAMVCKLRADGRLEKLYAVWRELGDRR